MLEILLNVVVFSIVGLTGFSILKDLVYDDYFSMKNTLYRVMNKKVKKEVKLNLFISDFKLMSIPVTFYLDNNFIKIKTDIKDYQLEKISNFLDSHDNLSEDDIVISHLKNTHYFKFKNSEIIPTDDLLNLIISLETKLDLPELKYELI